MLRLFLQTEHSIAIVDVQVKPLAMFIHRKSELISPFLGINGLAGSGALFLALIRDSDAALVSFIGFEIKDKQILVLTFHELSNEFISASRVPFHQLQYLCIEYPAGDGLGLVGGSFPDEGILHIIAGGSDHHHLCFRVYQHHDKVYIRCFTQARGIECQLEVTDRDTRLVAVVEVFATNNLKAIIAEVIVIDDVIIGGRRQLAREEMDCCR